MDLEQYVDRIIKEKGFNEDPEVQAQIRSDLLERVENRVNAMIMSNLKPEDLGPFETSLENGTWEKFVRDRIADIDELVATELLAFKTAYLG